MKEELNFEINNIKNYSYTGNLITKL